MSVFHKTAFLFARMGRKKGLLFAKECQIWQISVPHPQPVYADLHLLRVWPVCWNIKLSLVMRHLLMWSCEPHYSYSGINWWLHSSGCFPLSVLLFCLMLSYETTGICPEWRISLLNPLCMFLFTCQNKLPDLLDWSGYSELHLLSKSKAKKYKCYLATVSGNIFTDLENLALFFNANFHFVHCFGNFTEVHTLFPLWLQWISWAIIAGLWVTLAPVV